MNTLNAVLGISTVVVLLLPLVLAQVLYHTIHVRLNTSIFLCPSRAMHALCASVVGMQTRFGLCSSHDKLGSGSEAKSSISSRIQQVQRK